jgi:hypothetical protein
VPDCTDHTDDDAGEKQVTDGDLDAYWAPG